MEINEDRYTRRTVHFLAKLVAVTRVFRVLIFPRNRSSECVNNASVIVGFADISPSDQILSSLSVL